VKPPPKKEKRPLASKALSNGSTKQSQNAGSQSSSIVERLQGLREEPAPEEEQTLFGFLEEISLSPKKRDRDATSSILQPNSSHIAAETVGEKAVLRKRARRRHEITGTFPAAA